MIQCSHIAAINEQFTLLSMLLLTQMILLTQINLRTASFENLVFRFFKCKKSRNHSSSLTYAEGSRKRPWQRDESLGCRAEWPCSSTCGSSWTCRPCKYLPPETLHDTSCSPCRGWEPSREERTPSCCRSVPANCCHSFSMQKPQNQCC